MKATELQIGDLVWLSDDICIKVEQITKRKIGYHAKANESKMHYARLCDIEPIPITPEILEKNGFTKESFVSSTHYYCNYNESHIRAFKFYGEDDVYVNEIEPHMPSAPLIKCARFKYVHELQHALRLCKMEKEIKL